MRMIVLPWWGAAAVSGSVLVMALSTARWIPATLAALVLGWQLWRVLRQRIPVRTGAGRLPLRRGVGGGRHG